VYEVRPLTWREKLRLARFAHLGEPFVEARFMEASVVGPKSLAATETTHAVLLALAMWINLPSEQRPGLPLDQHRLATVTVELCRSLGTGPLAIGDLTAGEVEMLWKSLQQGPGGEALDKNTSEQTYDTKIMIVPDQTQSDAEPRPHSSSPASRRPEDLAGRDSAQPAIRPVLTGITDGRPAALRVPDAVRPSADDIPHPASAVAGPRENDTERRAALKRDMTTRFRVSFDQPTAKSPDNTPAPALDLVERADSPKTSAEMEVYSNLQTPASPTLRRSVPGDKHWESHQSEIRQSRPETEVDSILDEFCERLAEAAADLGITEEV